MRKIIIAGNWKMNKTVGESLEMVHELIDRVSSVDKVDIVICPTYIALNSVSDLVCDTNIKLGAQNMWYEASGAYTGEISGEMLKSVGCEYVIIGHSERREYFSESNELINKKLKKALKIGLLPILCVGEKLEEREKGITEAVVRDHVIGGLVDISKEDLESVIIAYEPVWAIGTGKTATPEQADDVHAFIRKLIEEKYDKESADKIRIQYGGSVKPSNVTELMSKENIDGALVGGASLDADSFEKLIIT